jgi:exopolysaccharide biosynthesis WecB/TagA/CpsF family protein
MNLQAAIPDLPQPAACDILGVSVARVGWDEAQGLLRVRIAARRFTKVGFLNAHNANVACADADFSDALSRFLVLPDGVGVDVAARLLYGSKFPANLNGTDFVPALLKSVEKPLKVGLLGATRRNADAAAAVLARIAPQHAFTVVHDGFFTVEQEPEILSGIAALRPDVLLVAMGVPRQEFWIDRNLTSRHCTLPIAVGALLDFLSGAVPRAPLWVRRLRMEWLYRLVQEPGRLWRRYIVGNPLFLTRVLKQKLFATRSSR